MPLAEYEPDLRPVREAEENLRMIRGLMERSTRHSTFSGLSGVLAGLYSIAGAIAQWKLLPKIQHEHPLRSFIALWGAVVLAALATDFLLTKRRAARVGKYIRSHLGRQMIRAAGPGLLTAGILTVVLADSYLFWLIPPIWMLCYGTAVCAVGQFSQKEVTWLGWAFLAAGLATMLLQWLVGSHGLYDSADGPIPVGLLMTAISFGGFHIVYGISVARRDGW